ncbi:hypothetical protein MalM25_06810 [Planctomycetes bacterium MalM25]|nr:hypothetical protein MalM25_06810 [Planctomycetes bacterium MalM25]
MRVTHNTADRLVLQGTPGGMHWMFFMLLFGVTAMAMCAWFAYTVAVETGNYVPILPLAIGFLFGLVFAWMGATTLIVGRLKLTLDRLHEHGEYEVNSPIIEAGKPCRFHFKAIDSLVIESTFEARHKTNDTANFDARVSRLRLRLTKPRRAITLDETQNGQEQRLEKLGAEVAEWLGFEPPKAS